MALSLKEGQITDEERRALKENAFRSGGSYEYADEAGGNDGFLDTYNGLAQRIRHTRTVYQEQLNALAYRENDQNKRIRETTKLIIIVASTIVLLYVYYAARNEIRKAVDGIDIITGIMLLLEFIVPVAVFVLSLYMLPLLIIQLIKERRTRSLLCGTGLNETLAKEKGLVTYREERAYLNEKLREIDDFMSRTPASMLSEASNTNTKDTWTDAETAIIEKMQTLSLFREFHASSAADLSAMNYSWVFLICFLATIGIILLVLFGVPST